LTRPTGEIKRQTWEEKQAWREKRWYDARSLDIVGSKRLRNKIIKGGVSKEYNYCNFCKEYAIEMK